MKGEIHHGMQSKIFALYVSGTKRKAISKSVPAPAIAANTRPKSVGMVLDAKNIADSPTPIILNENNKDV